MKLTQPKKGMGQLNHQLVNSENMGAAFAFDDL